MKRIKLITGLGLATLLALGVTVQAQTSDQHTFTWQDMSSTEDGFRVYLVQGPRTGWVKVCEVPKDVTACTVTITPDQLGCYAAVSFNIAGESGISNVNCWGTPTPTGALSVQ